jgi:hypothetical protein
MVNGTDMTSGTAAFATTSAVDEEPKFESVGANVAFTCPAGQTHQEGETHFTIPFIYLSRRRWLQCVATTTNCTLSSPTIETVPLQGEPTLQGASAVRVALKPKTKATIATFEFTGSNCAAAGLNAITGTMTIQLPAGQDERTLQLITANISEASGELKVASSAASLKEGFLLALASGEPWSFL